LLAQCGSNLNASNLKGAKAIHLAVKEQKPQTICRLIELGLKVNCKDAHAKTPLHYAARVGDIEIGKLLIQLGAQLNHIDFKGRTPAGLAEEKEHFHFADMLEGLGGKRVKSYEDRSMFKKETLSVSNLQSLNIELSKELITANKVYKKLYKNIE
jgi:ankyrin repeat protein